MQLRIYIGLKPELESIESCKQILINSLGFAEIDLEKEKILRTGIVSKELIKRISENIPPEKRIKLEKMETFHCINNEWLSFNFLDKKERSHSNVLGALYHAELYPHKETKTEESIIVNTLTLNISNGVLCALVNTGRAAEKDINEIIEKISRAIKTGYNFEIVELTDNDLIELSKLCLNEGHKVTACSIDTVEGRATFEHPIDIFNDVKIQQADDIFKIKKSVETGNWNLIIFRILEPGYYLVINKSKYTKKFMTLYPITKRKFLDKPTASVIFKDLINKLSKGIKLKKPVQTRLANKPIINS